MTVNHECVGGFQHEFTGKPIDKDPNVRAGEIGKFLGAILMCDRKNRGAIHE